MYAVKLTVKDHADLPRGKHRKFYVHEVVGIDVAPVEAVYAGRMRGRPIVHSTGVGGAQPLEVSVREMVDAINKKEPGAIPSISKVVDENGEPLVVYHGTINDVPKFDPSAKKRTRGGRDGAFFFSPDTDIASAYAGTAEGRQWNESLGKYVKIHHGMDEGGNVMPVFLSMKNPLVVNAAGRVYDQIEDAAFAAAMAGRHDGIIFRNMADQPGAQGSLRAYESDAYVAFAGEQIKSAIGNTGEYSPKNDRVTKSITLILPSGNEYRLNQGQSGTLPVDIKKPYPKVEPFPLSKCVTLAS